MFLKPKLPKESISGFSKNYFQHKKIVKKIGRIVYFLLRRIPFFLKLAYKKSSKNLSLQLTKSVFHPLVFELVELAIYV